MRAFLDRVAAKLGNVLDNATARVALVAALGFLAHGDYRHALMALLAAFCADSAPVAVTDPDGRPGKPAQFNDFSL